MNDYLFREIFGCVPEIDFNSGYRYFLCSIENYVQAMLSTLKSIKAKLPILENMYSSDEYEGLRTITQTLRRMMNVIGANGLADLSYQLEVFALNSEDMAVRDQLVEYINCLYEFSEHLELLLKKLDVKNLGKNSDNQNPSMSYDFTKTKESIKLSTDLLERKII